MVKKTVVEKVDEELEIQENVEVQNDLEILPEIAVAQTINVEQINGRLKKIKKIIGEQHPVVAGERAHVAQDELLREVLKGIADGAEDPIELAKAALEVFNIEFTRWYK